MPKVALADTLVDWDLLIRSARKKANGQPELAAILDQLEEKLDRVRALDVERLALQAKLLQATQDLRTAREEGKGLAMRARDHLKGMMGMHEGLLEFRIRPRRPYGKRKPKPAAED